MSLDFRLPDSSTLEVDENGVPTGVTKALILSLMTVGISKIDDSTMNDLLVRTEVLRTLGIPFGYTQEEEGGKPTPWYPSKEDWENHRGITTNVRHETVKQWSKRMVEGVVQDAQRAVRESGE